MSLSSALQVGETGRCKARVKCVQRAFGHLCHCPINQWFYLRDKGEGCLTARVHTAGEVSIKELWHVSSSKA